MITDVKSIKSIKSINNIKDTLVNIKYNYNENIINIPKELETFLLEERSALTVDNIVKNIIKYVKLHDLYDIENNTIKLDNKLKVILKINQNETIKVNLMYHNIYEILLRK